jgi:hypothetical protein
MTTDEHSSLLKITAVITTVKQLWRERNTQIHILASIAKMKKKEKVFLMEQRAFGNCIVSIFGRRHDNQHNDTQLNDTQHTWVISDTA